jgi:hypothetical protein
MHMPPPPPPQAREELLEEAGSEAALRQLLLNTDLKKVGGAMQQGCVHIQHMVTTQHTCARTQCARVVQAAVPLPSRDRQACPGHWQALPLVHCCWTPDWSRGCC